MFSKFNPFHLTKKVALLEKERDELLVFVEEQGKQINSFNEFLTKIYEDLSTVQGFIVNSTQKTHADFVDYSIDMRLPMSETTVLAALGNTRALVEDYDAELSKVKEKLCATEVELNTIKEKLCVAQEERNKAYSLCDKWFETVVGFGVNENTLITKSLHGQKLEFIPAP